MKRLLHLAGYEPEQRGSFVPFVLEVLLAARERGWEVEAVFPEGARGRFWLEDLRRAEIPVSFASGSRRDLTRWLDERLAGGGPAVLHTHFTKYDIPAALAARRRPGVCAYWHVHTFLARRPLRFAAQLVKFGLLGRHVERILTPADNVARAIAHRGGEKAKISVLANPIDLDAFPPIDAERRAEIRESLGIPADAEVLLHQGRDWRVKGGRVFLDALAELAAEGRPVLGLFNRPDREAERYIEQKRLGGLVETIGLIPDPQLLYGAADAMVAPSRGEAMPFTVVESLCCGTPVVASDLPGHRFLGDALEACAIVPREPGEVAAATRSFLDLGAAGRARACGAAREWIAARLDVRVAARRLVDQYEGSLAGLAVGRSATTAGAA